MSFNLAARQPCLACNCNILCQVSSPMPSAQDELWQPCQGTHTCCKACLSLSRIFVVRDAPSTQVRHPSVCQPKKDKKNTPPKGMLRSPDAE